MEEHVVKIFTHNGETATQIKEALDEILVGKDELVDVLYDLADNIAKVDGIVIETVEGPEDETTETV